jgi:hypothetical protein
MIMKVDLTKKAGNAALSATAKRALGDLHSFSEVKRARGLLEKLNSAGEIEVTDDEFSILFSIFQNTPTEEKLVFADMTESLNEGFDIVKYENGEYDNPEPEEDRGAPTSIED